ncbi:hypothetical protein [Paraburkholderia nodosa]|uniref:hypothetical protein n=1 Tax=Paraburkholderia nodosa TaxID=392320 RepID=UPI000482366B|nr:hypothetical protein [Paraburkholderia nodosa]
MNTPTPYPTRAPTIDALNAFVALAEALVRDRDLLLELHAKRVAHEGVEAVSIEVTFPGGTRLTVIAADDPED